LNPDIDEVPEQQPEQLELVDVLLFFGVGLPVFVVAMILCELVLRTSGVTVFGARALIAQFFGYAATLPILQWIIRVRHDVSAWHLIRLGVGWKDASVSVSLGVFTAIAVAMASVLLRTPKLKTPMEDLLNDPLSLGMAAVLGVTIGPFFEELVFRGVLQTLFHRYAHAVVAVVFSSLLFALLHGPQYAWSWRHVLLITAAGSAFGVRRLITDSTGAAAVMHGAYNMVLFVALIAAKLTI
jgi:membrane protease YdiL (CAAX protease family)